MSHRLALLLSLLAACDPIPAADDAALDTAALIAEAVDDVALQRATPAQTGLDEDVSGDGVDDLLVGLPGEGYPGQPYGGYVQVFRGVAGAPASATLSTSSSELWSQASAGVPGDVQDGEAFGAAVALADVDCDGRADAIIGLPSSDVAGTVEGGAVQIIRGGGALLTGTNSQLFDQDDLDGSAGDHDHLGAALTANDFDHNGCGDFIVGAPDDGGQGSVTLVAGAPMPPGFPWITLARRYLAADVGYPAGTQFGAAMVSADFNRDNRPDLVIGAPRHDVSGVVDAGAVTIITNVDLSSPASYRTIHLNTTGVDGAPDRDDGFGGALAAGDFNCDGYADLAIGAPREKIGAVDGAGAVHVLYGTSAGLSTTGDQWLYQGLSGAGGAAAAGDRFGEALAAGDFNGDRCADLAIGSPGEGATDRGLVQIVMGSSANKLKWSGVKAIVQPAGESEDGDELGAVLATGDYNDDGRDELVIGIPSETVGTQVAAGAVHVYAWGGASLSVSQRITQATANVAGDAEAQDRLGFALPR